MNLKSLILKICAAVLVAFYILSIGGINVHTCSHTGARYLTFLAEGISCQDIHPAHHSEGCSCCHHEDHDCDGDDGCCTNDSRQLQLTGDSFHSAAQKHLSIDEVILLIPFIPSFCEIAETSVPQSCPFALPDIGVDILSANCTLRV